LHVTPNELRAVRRRELTLRSTRLGPVAAVLAEVPATGSARTTLEDPCERAHWTVMLRGELDLTRGRQRWQLIQGQAFYVPAGKPAHRFLASRRAVVAGFVPLDASARDTGGSVALADRKTEPESVALGEVDAMSVPAGPWVMTRSAFGATSGYGTSWCDVPHWGIVVSGSAVIEYEDDVEVISAGDFFYCPPGPPGHKIEVADGAVFIDFTPRDAVRSGARISDWRAASRAFEPVLDGASRR
jgi:quercetin dioxygenase-like cupin family protein